MRKMQKMLKNYDTDKLFDGNTGFLDNILFKNLKMKIKNKYINNSTLNTLTYIIIITFLS